LYPLAQINIKSYFLAIFLQNKNRCNVCYKRFSGFLGVCSLINGKPAYAYLNDGTLLEFAGNKLIGSDSGCLKGTVVDFTNPKDQSWRGVP